MKVIFTAQREAFGVAGTRVDGINNIKSKPISKTHQWERHIFDSMKSKSHQNKKLGIR